MMETNNIISDWLDEHGDPEIYKKVGLKLEEMSKERYNQIIDEVYNNYVKISKPTLDGKYLSQPEFIFWVKTNDEFSKKWGLKIEERKLGNEERRELYNKNYESLDKEGLDQLSAMFVTDNITPTKLITLTYNNETIEVYG